MENPGGITHDYLLKVMNVLRIQQLISVKFIEDGSRKAEEESSKFLVLSSRFKKKVNNEE